jgi:hypothetical protein
VTVYGFDRGARRPVAQRIAPTSAEVATPLSPDA